MKHLQTYESFKKTYGQKISTGDFKKIPVGKTILYMGSRYEVLANDGYVLKLKGEDGDMINVNLGQFNHGGQINEAVNLKQGHLSSAEYQKAKKLKDFNPDDWSWNADTQLYDRVNESLNEAAYVPSNIMDFAKRKGSYATALVKKAASWAEKAGKRISGGTAIGKNYDTIILDMKYQGSEIYINLNDETIELFGEEVNSPKDFQKVLSMNESAVNEGRTIEKIEKDRTRVINDMAEMVTNWKAAKQSGDKEAEASFLQRLKDLTATRKGLEKELNQAIAGKDRNVELVISESTTIFEGVMSEIDLLAKEAKNFKDFVKEFKKEYSDLTDAGDAKELEQWLKTVYDAAQMDEGVTEAEEVKKAIHDHWKELYGEDFISEYPKVAKILKNRPHVDRRELARIWDQVYGEDFKKEYPGMWDRMEEAEEVSERNAFLGARAKAIEEDLEEFEFNGKMYPVLNKSK